MGRIQTGVRVVAACVVLAVAVGCSGGISLAGSDDDVQPSTDVVDTTCPAGALSGGTCSVEGSACETAVFCQRCAAVAWNLRSASCWCWDGTWGCDHVDCRPPYAGTYSDPDCRVRWGADGDADAYPDADADADAGADADADVGDCVPPCRSGFTCYYGICVPSGADADADADDDADITCVTGAECPSGVCLDGYCLPVGGDAGADGDADACAGGWLDPTSGLCWQDPPDETLRQWYFASPYCEALSVGGHDNWHLPSIDELRSLIRGCPATELGGACRVSDTCVSSGCWNEPCRGCASRTGPGPSGTYWPPELPDTTYWMDRFCSSSSDPGAPDAWVVLSANGEVALDSFGYVRCVRPGP